MFEPHPSAHAPRILVIQPDEEVGLERFGDWLGGDGNDLDVIRPFLGETVPVRADADGVIVLGGAMGAMDDAEYPWLTQIKALLVDSLDRQVPVFGICLGAQLLAVAGGGVVRPGKSGLECGIVAVRWSDSAPTDVLVAGLSPEFSAATMHFDEIESLPPTAVLLGTGDAYPHQVFRVGSAWGVQFHPEVTPARFASWRSDIDPASRDEYDAHAEHVERVDEEVRSGTEQLALRFSAIVRGRTH